MPSRHLCRAFLGVPLAALLCLASTLPLRAQTTSASVSGSVKDAQGAVLPGALVALTSSTQGNTQTTVSDDQGNFVFSFVRPDTYRVNVKLDGFQALERGPVVVNANDRFSIGILSLQVGQLTETVTVTGRVTELQSLSGERSYALEASQIENIAVNGRSFFGLVGLVPGVVPGQSGMSPSNDPPSQASHFSANGQRQNSNNLTIDGVANVDTGDNGGNMTTTNLEAVAEFKVLTSSYQAEYGRAVGAQVQVVTKSGSRDFSGSGYWYGRRSDWNSNTWTNIQAGIEKAKASRNDSGYTFGGPIFIPGKFNEQRNRLFFFWAQEFQRRNDPVAETRTTVPTALERQGDFSQSVDASGNPFPFIRDWTTGLPCSASDTRGCFQDGGVLGRIPQSRLYQPTRRILDLFPGPNTSGTTGYNYGSQQPNSQPRREELIRLDYQASTDWRVTGRYMQNGDTRDLPLGVNWATGANVDTFDGHHDQPGYNWVLSTTGVLNDTTSLEISVGSAHNSLDIYTTNDDLTRSGAGISDLPMFFPGAIQNDLIPRARFGGGRIGTANPGENNGPAEFRTQQGPFTNFNTTYDIVVNATKVMGSHTAKAGIYYQRSQKDQSAFAPFNGDIEFNNNANNPFDTGHPYANAALGVFNNFTQASQFAKPKWRYTNLEWYLQDNWRARDRLTLDYGVRFYYLTPQYDASNLASNFLPDAFDPSQEVRLYQPRLIDGRRMGFDPITGTSVAEAFIGRVVPGSGDRFNGAFQAGQGIDESLADGSRFKVSPRVGATYDLTGTQSAIVRGGFGIFYDRPQGNIVFDLIANPPGVVQQRVEWGRFQDLSGTTPLPGTTELRPTQFDWEVPTVYGWNLGFQLKLPSAFTLDIAYVGSESRNLAQQRQLNAVPYGAKFLPENQDPTRAASSTPGASALPDDFLRPLTGYNNVRMWEFEAFSDYKALQMSLNRRFDRGLLLGVNYTRSSSKGTVSDDFAVARIDGRDREANYGPMLNDRPHHFTTNFVYQTPQATSDRFLRWLVNDWQFSGVYRWMTGNPYEITFDIPGITAANLTGSDGNQNARVVVVGDPGSGSSDDPYRQFNALAFAPPQPGSIGLESERFFLYRPAINNLDLSISKMVPLGGNRRFEIRLDAFNALNHTQFFEVNRQVRFASLTDPTITNLAYDASGNLINPSGFGAITSVRPARQLQLVTRFSF
jgi:hypothetical protein